METVTESPREHVSTAMELLSRIPSGVLMGMGNEHRRNVVDAAERLQLAMRGLDSQKSQMPVKNHWMCDCGTPIHKALHVCWNCGHNQPR